MNITGTDFVLVPTQDFDRACAFYGETLGLPFGKRWGDMPGAEYETGNLTIAVWDPTAFGRPFASSSSAIALQVDDVAGARTELESRGVAFPIETIDSGVCHMAYFADPDGNPLILHRRYAPKGQAPPAAAASA